MFPAKMGAAVPDTASLVCAGFAPLRAGYIVDRTARIPHRTPPVPTASGYVGDSKIRRGNPDG